MSPSLEEKSSILTPIDLASLEPDAANVSFLLRDTAARRPTAALAAHSKNWRRA